jgi:ABC-type multidrug transport system fused ATPase/permease subunit
MCKGLILAYHNGWVMTQKFIAVHDRFNKAAAHAMDYFEHTIRRLQIGFAALVTLVTIVSGIQTRRGKMEVGSYVVLLSAAERLGTDLISLAKLANTMVSGSAAVTNIAEILNKETRREERCMKNLRKRCSMPEGQGVAQDLGWHGAWSDIVLENVEYRYETQHDFAVPSVSLRLPAGNLVCFPQSSAKKTLGMDTFFRIMAGVLQPETGKVKMNARWQVVYVPLQPVLFSGSLMFNLTMLLETPPPDEEVWSMCRSLGMSEELIQQSWFDVGQSGDTLRHSDLVLVAIAQGLLSGVDVLLLSTIIDSIGPGKAAQVLPTFRQYVQERGLPGQTLPFEFRHQKTIIYTSKLPSLWEPARPDYLVTHPDDFPEDGPADGVKPKLEDRCYPPAEDFTEFTL